MTRKHQDPSPHERESTPSPITEPRPFVFVLMPFADEFNDTYQLAIKPAAVAAGAHCERVDEEHFDELIIQRIRNQIATARLIVAELSKPNPNVFYETGYAHALGKQTVLLARKDTDLIFDLNQYQHVLYADLTDLRSQLQERIRWCLTHPDRPYDSMGKALKVFLNNTPVHHGAVIPSDVDRISTRLQLTLVNPTAHMVDARDLMFGLVLPRDLISSPFSLVPITLPSEGTRLLSGDTMVKFRDFGELFPQETVVQDVLISFQALVKPGDYPIALLQFTPFGVTQTRLTLRLTQLGS